ncbi:Long-chain-fatty-acid--CoA ligase FadD13 [Brevundimonas sp. SH203]|uniref:class I adenylate-forming enzyme family protein n=1 Tax=Brevundimonas sp. SH203 TaxID=345167 RepID=UPI0009D1CA4D|nr:AMP-binding protein [Brevundimonas sp. SH203]GAW40956.1 Long-chain-fatty-acid--CoA ligase FadD13 [Brevundimonas sp. SH203]
MTPASLSEAITDHAQKAGDRPALIEGGVSLTYAGLDLLLNRAAAALRRDGLSAGDRVALLGEPSIQYVAAFLAAVRAGITPVPLAPSVTDETLASMLEDAGPRLVFSDASQSARLGAEATRGAVVTLDGSHGGAPWAEWLEGEGTAFVLDPVAPSAPFNIIYSSGTTGVPKGIVHSHAMREGQMAALGGLFAPESVTLLTTPLYSNTTLVMLLPALRTGGSVVIMRKFDTAVFLNMAQKHRVTHAMLVPVQYQRLMAEPAFDDADLSAFQIKFCTSAPFSAELKSEVLRRWPGGLLEIFGMTEGGGTCFLPAHLFPHKLHTVGMPAPGSDMRIIDEAGVEQPIGEIGEIVSRSDMMMAGYNNRPEATAAGLWTAPDGRAFIRTGDLGRFDAEGFLQIVGRKKDMIISGGFNIYPIDLEVQIDAHPDVAESAVIGVPDARWGETPMAFVVRREGAVIEAEALRVWVNERLSAVQRISRIAFLDALPRNGLGKVLKTALAETVAP